MGDSWLPSNESVGPNLPEGHSFAMQCLSRDVAICEHGKKMERNWVVKCNWVEQSRFEQEGATQVLYGIFNASCI